MVLSDVVVLDSLLYAEDRRLTPLLTTISQTAPALLGPYATKSSKHTGQLPSWHVSSVNVHDTEIFFSSNFLLEIFLQG